MKTLIVILIVMAGGVLHADAVFARGGSAGAGAAAGAAGAGAGAASGTAGAAAGAPSGAAGAAAPAAADGTGVGDTGAGVGPGAGGDSSAVSTGPGDNLGGGPAGYANDPAVYRSPATAWPGEVVYPSASPRGPAVVAPYAVVGPPSAVIITPRPPVISRSPERIEVLTEPLVCPGVNPSDPRKC